MPETHVVGDGADAITFDVHGDLADATPDRPVLMVMGSPMDASGFGTLAGHFTDRPVVTYDPRGTGRNPTDSTEMTPAQHGEDLHRVITAVGAGPIDVFASSGGAVNAIALVTAHPEDVLRLVAHEPPIAAFLPDRDAIAAVCADIRATYEKSGQGPAMAKFIGLVMFDGEITAEYLERPAPDPAMFGMSAEDDGGRNDPLMRNMVTCTGYQPDVSALAALGDRLVVAVGRKSGDTMAARGGRSVAAATGVPVVEVAGDHGGFLGGEYGQTGEPDAFAADLRALLER